MSIAFLDVCYETIGARAACVLAESWESESPHSTCACDIEAVEPYEPGSFYRRELPCLLSVLHLLPSLPDIAVVDGYVWLASLDRPGLGARLYEALGAVPVVGIAKSAFKGSEASAAVVPVYRGASRRPLFVSAVGIAPELAARCVCRMAGSHRIPEMARIADCLSRSNALAVDAAYR